MVLKTSVDYVPSYIVFLYTSATESQRRVEPTSVDQPFTRYAPWPSRPTQPGEAGTPAPRAGEAPVTARLSRYGNRKWNEDIAPNF